MKEYGSFTEESMEILTEEARKHIEKNIIPATDGRKCVDGRYPSGTGEIARAGGDMGYVEILLSLNREKELGLTPSGCVDLVYGYTTKDGGMFSLHSDRHADPTETDHLTHGELPLIGCGHCAKAAQEELAKQYQLSASDVKEAVLYVRERYRSGDAIDLVVLEGEHAEKGAIIVDSLSYSINERDVNNESMYFIYDRARDEEYMQGFVDWLVEEKGLNISYAEFKEISDLQTNATLRILAPEKPLFQVELDERGQVNNLQFVSLIT